jgi:hypothetical protein
MKWVYMLIRKRGFCSNCGRKLTPGDDAVVAESDTVKGRWILLCARQKCAQKDPDAAVALERALAKTRSAQRWAGGA